jgi:hypothetical protein
MTRIQYIALVQLIESLGTLGRMRGQVPFESYEEARNQIVQDWAEILVDEDKPREDAVQFEWIPPDDK